MQYLQAVLTKIYLFGHIVIICMPVFAREDSRTHKIYSTLFVFLRVSVAEVIRRLSRRTTFQPFKDRGHCVYCAKKVSRVDVGPCIVQKKLRILKQIST